MIPIISILIMLLGALAGENEPQRPNVVLINVDDLGWKDLACMGSRFYETPNIDELAKGGLVFTNAYACAANCAPSRAGMLSGRYTTTHGIYTVGTSERGDKRTRRLIPVKNQTVLADSFYTLAEMLRDNGYRTGIFGKWHLGDDARTQGFDVNVGGGHHGNPGKNGYFSPYNIDFIEDGPPGEYLPDRLTSEAIDFMEANRKNPFFLYLPYYSVHTPIMGKKDLIKRFAGKEGQNGQGRADYAAMIYAVDQNIGRLLGKLEELGLEDNTLVIFTSDNGGVDHISDQDPLRAGKGSFYEGGIRVPLIIKWSGAIAPGRSEYPVTNMDFYPTLKAIVSPSGKPGQLDGMDLGPVLFGRKTRAVRDLFWHFPVYLQANGPRLNKELRDPLFRTRPGSVVRSGNWKLHEYFEDEGLELYNLEKDPGERHNLAKSMPEKAKELQRLLHEWRKAHQAPVPTTVNPAFDLQYQNKLIGEIKK